MDTKREQELKTRLAGAELSLARIEMAMTIVIQAKTLRMDYVAFDDPVMKHANRAWEYLREMQEATIVDVYDLNKQISSED